MKKFAKFIPVALGLLALTSCSNDNLFGEQSSDAVQLKDGDMLVSVAEPKEDGEAFTRGYTSRDMKSRRWYSGVDKLSAYGQQFGAYDTYMFKQGIGDAYGQFEIVSNPSYVKEPMWALFPQDQIKNGKWTLISGLYNSTATVDVVIPQKITYDAAYDAAHYATNKEPYYLDNLPRWGKITKTNDGKKLETELSWMTGILRIQLAGAPRYSNGIRVQLFENGDPTKPIRLNSASAAKPYWTVKIAQNDEPIPGACVEFDGTDYADYSLYEGQVDGALYVEIPNLEKLTAEDRQRAVIYLPLPVTPKKQVDIVVSAWDYATAGGYWNGVVDPSATPWAWKTYGVYKNKTIKNGYVYGNKSEYNLALDGTNPGAITDALELIETSEDVITVVANNPIDVCEASHQTTIEIPNKVGKKQIVIDLRNGLVGCDPDQTLNIVYKDATDKFEGNVTLLTPDVDGSNPVKLNVALDKSSFSIVQGKCIQQDETYIDAREFVVGNEDITTPTPAFKANQVKFSNNVKKFWVASQASINSFVIDQTDANPENWKHGGVTEIEINGETGIAGGAIDASSYVPETYAVAVKVLGENANTVDIKTNGTVDINAGLYDMIPATIGDVFAGQAVTATGYAGIGSITSAKATISLSGYVQTGELWADGNISIIEEANVPTDDITSDKGNITIDNAYATTAALYKGNITADKGTVSLNQVGAEKTKYQGTIIANEFVMTGKTAATNAITAHGKATVNVDAQDGNCAAIGGTSGSLILDNPTTNEVNLLQGYVKEIKNPAAVETSLTFATTAAYAAIGSVANPDKLIPTNTSIWNGDYKLEAYADFATRGYNHDDGRIWTATQLGYQNNVGEALDDTDASSGVLEIRANIDLDNQPWPGIVQDATTTINGMDKTISNVNLKGNNTTKTAGFYTTCSEVLTISNLTFNGVQTTIAGVSGGKFEGGIGAVAGRLQKGVALTRVAVKLAGTNFGTVPGKNAQTSYVGGLVGTTGWANLYGCQVDATGVALTGYRCMGGFIGRSYNVVNIKMDEGNDAEGIPEMYPEVKGLTFCVTYDATQGLGAKTNDPDQGTTGWFIGYLNVEQNLTIFDVADTDVKRDIVQTADSKANEAKAVLIINPSEYYYFRRDFAAGKADQTLVGNSGFYTGAGKYYIDGVEFAIYKAGEGAPVDSKRLYSLTMDPYIP